MHRHRLFFVVLLFYFSFYFLGCQGQRDMQKLNKLTIQKKPVGPFTPPLPRPSQEQGLHPGAGFTWDFGKVKEGTLLRHTFIFKNESKKNLTIQNITTSCGCTVSETKKKILMPQESTAIDVSFNSKGYSGITQQFIYLHTDNLDNPIIKFIIKADVAK